MLGKKTKEEKKAFYDAIVKRRYERPTDVLRKIKICIPAQAATIAPPLGPVLGQLGINIVEFCKEFNLRTQEYNPEVMLNTVIFFFRNKTIKFQVRGVSTAFLASETYEDVTWDDDEVPFLLLSNFYAIIAYRSVVEGANEIELATNLRASLDSMNIQILDDIEMDAYEKFLAEVKAQRLERRRYMASLRRKALKEKGKADVKTIEIRKE